MPEPTRVAIIVRTLDRPVLLARALAGILAQTHRCWHVVLVNGGDPAPVDALATTYATAFGNRLSVLHAAPAGPDRAAELGFAHPSAMQAELVAVHDDDDAWQPDFLRAGVSCLANDDSYAATASQAWQIDERMEEGGMIEEGRREGFSAAHPLELATMLGGAGVPLICLLTRRAVLDAMLGTATGHGAIPPCGPADFARGLLLRGDVAVLSRRLAFTYRRGIRSGAYANRSARAAWQDGPQQTRGRNAMLRALAASDPALPGLVPALGTVFAAEMQLVLDRLDRNAGWGHGRHEDLQGRLIRIENAIGALQQPQQAPVLHNVMLRPVQRAWRLMARPRRLLARLRGRIG